MWGCGKHLCIERLRELLQSLDMEDNAHPGVALQRSETLLPVRVIGHGNVHFASAIDCTFARSKLGVGPDGKRMPSGTGFG